MGRENEWRTVSFLSLLQETKLRSDGCAYVKVAVVNG